ncbi:hypothetical protein [Nostoc sp. MG11]|uniref:hypothetical protein n=1 Tax=Nostoc sp. MG11 TaxID=2721166 RepID=UPI001D00D61F|nr:hypothetical protein [Nostoc sp. MG11]
MLWASKQKPSVTQLWQECCTADPYGSRWMPLSAEMGYSTFISAKKILSYSGLFIFKPDKSIQDGRETVGWMIRNLHGSRMKEFCEQIDSASQKTDAEKQAPNSENLEKDAASKEMRALYRASISEQTQSEQGFQNPSRTPQKLLTNSSEEFVRSNSSTQNENTHCEETAIAPIGGASPQIIESVEEEKELPVVTDCTSLREAAPTLTLVDAVQGQSALLLGENLDCGVEPKNCHVRAASRREGTFSAAPVAQNEKSLNSAIAQGAVPKAIANQTQGQVEQSNSASLLVENSVSGVEVKAVHEGTCSVAPVPNAEKWSHEAIVARSNLRPERMQKLKVAGNSGQNPGFEFLQECWSDDPALVIMIKKLLVKFPQWGIAIMDGVLIEPEG